MARRKTQGKTEIKEISEKTPAKWGNVIGIIIAFAIAAIPFAYGRYFEVNYPDPFDSAAYTYSAQHIFAGAKLGVDEVPSAQPGTLLVNMLGVKLYGPWSEVGPKLVQTFLQAVALVVMFFTLRKFFGGLAAAVSLFIAALYLSAPLISKYGNVKEQHMIAFMIIGVCCYARRVIGGPFWLALISGAALGWAGIFKQTGVSAMGAVVFYVVAAAIFRLRSAKETLADIGLLATGFVIGIAPVWAWLLAKGDLTYYSGPYAWVWPVVTGIITKIHTIFTPSTANTVSGQPSGDYVTGARQLFGFSKQAPIVLRYYGVLVLPMVLALGAIVIWAYYRILYTLNKDKNRPSPCYYCIVPLFTVWWLLDMVFVWVSPRSYEQYYLPLCASAACLGGFVIAVWRDKVVASKYHPKWLALGLFGAILMIVLGWHVVFGVYKSPFSGGPYYDSAGMPARQKGYVQRFEEVEQMNAGETSPYQQIGDYIRENSEPNDTIYVWGWFPGIYLRAQRFAPTPWAFESEMNVRPPEGLAKLMDDLLTSFKKKPPKFLVDTLKRDFPWNRWPLPLWPIDFENGKLVTGSAAEVAAFDAKHAQRIRKEFGEADAQRYMAMKPMRDYVMKYYKPIMIEQHILFERKSDAEGSH